MHTRAPRQQHMQDEGQPTLADCGIGIACTRAPRQQHMQDEGLGMNSVRFGVSGCELETSFTRGSLWNCVVFFEMFCIVLDLVRKGGVFEMFCIRLSQEKGGQDRHAQEG